MTKGVPGELVVAEGSVELNAGRPVTRIEVRNTSDQPIDVGSHYHFAEVNAALSFDRQVARGRRLEIPAGTSLCFEPGEVREVGLIDFAGARVVHGFRGQVMGALDEAGPTGGLLS